MEYTPQSVYYTEFGREQNSELQSDDEKSCIMTVIVRRTSYVIKIIIYLTVSKLVAFLICRQILFCDEHFNTQCCYSLLQKIPSSYCSENIFSSTVKS